MRVYVVWQMLGARCMFQNLIGIKEPMITSANVNLHYEPSTLLSPLYRRGSEVLNNLPMIIQLERNWGTSPVVQWLIKTLPSNAGMWVQFLVRELMSHMPGVLGKFKKKKKKERNWAEPPDLARTLISMPYSLCSHRAVKRPHKIYSELAEKKEIGNSHQCSLKCE